MVGPGPTYVLPMGMTVRTGKQYTACAGYCDKCGQWVYVSADGSCSNGHGAESVSSLYDAQPPSRLSRLVPRQNKSAIALSLVIALVLFVGIPTVRWGIAGGFRAPRGDISVEYVEGTAAHTVSSEAELDVGDDTNAADGVLVRVIEASETSNELMVEDVSMWRDGEERFHEHVFVDGSTLTLISVPAGGGEGLELRAWEIERPSAEMSEVEAEMALSLKRWFGDESLRSVHADPDGVTAEITMSQPVEDVMGFPESDTFAEMVAVALMSEYPKVKSVVVYDVNGLELGTYSQ